MTPHACMRETASCADAACAQGGDKDPYVLSMRGIDHKVRAVSTRDLRALPSACAHVRHGCCVARPQEYYIVNTDRYEQIMNFR